MDNYPGCCSGDFIQLLLIMDAKETKSDKSFLRVIAIFLAFFAALIFIAAGLSDTAAGAVTNFVCGTALVLISIAFYAGYKRTEG